MDLKKEILAIVLATIVVLSGVAWAAAISPGAAAVDLTPTTLNISPPNLTFVNKAFTITGTLRLQFRELRMRTLYYSAPPTA